MPIRIKPTHDLRPCVLDLDSIKEICALVEQNFKRARFTAEDGVWEVFNENAERFIPAISPRETLDSFTVKASTTNRVEKEITGEPRIEFEAEKTIRIIFDADQAKVSFSGSHELENWFEHFMIDLKKHLRPPLFCQRLINNGGRDFGIAFLALASLTANSLSGGKYCQIILHKRPPVLLSKT